MRQVSNLLLLLVSECKAFLKFSFKVWKAVNVYRHHQLR